MIDESTKQILKDIKKFDRKIQKDITIANILAIIENRKTYYELNKSYHNLDSKYQTLILELNHITELIKNYQENQTTLKTFTK